MLHLEENWMQPDGLGVGRRWGLEMGRAGPRQRQQDGPGREEEPQGELLEEPQVTFSSDRQQLWGALCSLHPLPDPAPQLIGRQSRKRAFGSLLVPALSFTEEKTETREML